MPGMETSLKPTLWRTALANGDRLNLLYLVWTAKGGKGVGELAAEANLPAPTASLYLRALNARGLISVIRSGAHVYYGTAPDRSLPAAMSLREAFRKLFALGKLPARWTDRLLPIRRAYSNPRRESIVRLLQTGRPMRYTEFRKRSGLCETSFLRHLGILTKAGVVVSSPDGVYSLAEPENPLAAALLNALFM